jgi:hypothetical protein
MSETQTRTRKKRAENVRPVFVVRDLPPVPVRRGAPTTYTKELSTRFLQRLAQGELAVNLCQEEGMPAVETIYGWIGRHPEFAQEYARARELQAHSLAEQAITIAIATTPETVQVDRLKFDAMKWYASKVSPRNYGDKVQTELSGPNGGPLQIAAQVIDARSMTAEARAALREALRASLPAPAGRTIDVEPEDEA